MSVIENIFGRFMRQRTPEALLPEQGRVITLIGNCQTEALERTLSAMSPSVAVLGALPVGVDPANTLETHISALSSSDVILAQVIAEDYPVEWIRKSNLVREFGDKLVFIPNTYFTGYTPDMCYIHGAGARHVVPGPLGDYHLSPVIACYQKGLPVSAAVALYNSREFFEANFAGHAEASLAELTRREEGLDVKISDFIAANYKARRLFNTMNHPTAWTLIEVASRILKHLGVAHYDIREVTQDDYLSAIVKSPAAPLHEMLGMTFNNPPIDRAFALDDEGRQTGTIRYYDLPGLIEAFYRVYDRHREIVMAFPTGLHI